MGKTILFPVPNHGRWTRAVAKEIADIEDVAAVIVLETTPVGNFAAPNEDRQGETFDRDGDQQANRSVRTSAAMEVLAETSLDVVVRSESFDDNEADAILSVVDETNASRIYMFGRTRSPAGKAVYGSVLQQVLARSPVPVVVVPVTAV